MKLTVHLEGSTKAELKKGLMAHLALFGNEETDETQDERTEENETDTAEVEQEVAQTNTKANSKTQSASPAGRRRAADILAEAKAKQAQTFGEEESDEAEEYEEEETSEDEVTTDQVRAACAAYVKRLISKGNSKEDATAKVRATLKKNFKVTLVDQLDDSDLPKALKVITAAK